MLSRGHGESVISHGVPAIYPFKNGGSIELPGHVVKPRVVFQSEKKEIVKVQPQKNLHL